MTQFPIDVTIERLVEFHGLADWLCEQELGRLPTHTVGDPVAEIILLMALQGQTGPQIQAWLHDQPEAVAHRAIPPRPAPVRQTPLPPWDASDSENEVHTVPPPELVIPSGPDPLFMRADFNGVKLDLERWGNDLPILVGANTTPTSMLMTPMLPMYPRKWQDADLTEHCERGLTHFVVASDGWNMAENGFSWTPAQFVDWCQYVKSWVPFVVYWGPAVFPDPYLQAAVDAHAIDFHIVGEEVDGKMTAEAYEAALDTALEVTGGMPTGAHFTPNYPEGFPRDTFLTNWAKYDGRVHLMWQAHQDDSAGKQGAMLYYARQRVNLGLVGGNGQPAPNSCVYAFETMATAQLYGRCTEEYGCLRSLELLYCTRRDDRIRPLSGFGNGCRLPDGSAL